MTWPDRFWRLVDKNGPIFESLGPCWVWLAAHSVTGGYGTVTIDGKSYRAHRISWELLRGSIPSGLVLDHLCRNVRCVNPDHLEPVTDRINVLRSTSPIALNARKTHCPQGHAYEGKNLWVWLDSRGREHRKCHVCQSRHSTEGARRRRRITSA